MTTSADTPTLSLEAPEPSREVFLRAFVERLRRQGRSRDIIDTQRNAVSWFLASLGGRPGLATPEALDRFIAEATRKGTRPARIAALRMAVASAFDEMCGRPVAARSATRVREPEPPSPMIPSREAQPTEGERKRAHRSPRPQDPSSATDRRRARRLELIHALHAEMGLRPSEIARLEWPHIDLAAKRLLIPTPGKGTEHGPTEAWQSALWREAILTMPASWPPSTGPNRERLSPVAVSPRLGKLPVPPDGSPMNSVRSTPR